MAYHDGSEDRPFELIDDNIEILLEDIDDQDDGAYMYVRIQKEPDDEDLIARMYDGSAQIACGRHSYLTKGTVPQLATCFMLLFEQDDIFLEAAAAAVRAIEDMKNIDG